MASLSVTSAFAASSRVFGQAKSDANEATAASGFSVMLWTLRAGRDFEQQLQVVAQAGYGHVELVDEFLHWSDEELFRILGKMRSLGLTVDAMAGLKTGFADPDRGDAFLSELRSLIVTAHRLHCPQIILLSGNRLEGLTRGQQHAASLATLSRAAELLQKEDLVGVIEPIDPLENASIYLDGVTEAFSLTRAIGSPHMKVLYDLYHEQRSAGNLIEKLEQNIAEVGLIHLADVPGRHQPGTGEINVSNLFRTLSRLQYKGIVAMEFYPTSDAVETLRRARLDAEQYLRLEH